MSPELETLDQLLGGDLSLATVRTLFSSDARFSQALTHLLSVGDVTMLTSDGASVPNWKWRELLTPVPHDLKDLKLRITDRGILKIK